LRGTCRLHTGRQLGPFDGRGLFYTQESLFPLKAGETYEIFGLSLFNGGLIVLVAHDEIGAPLWVPHRLFEVARSRLPGDWRFAVHGTGDLEGGELEAVWGDALFTGSVREFEALVEGTPATSAAFRALVRRRLDARPDDDLDTVAESVGRDQRIEATCRSATAHEDRRELPLTAGKSYEVQAMALFDAGLVFLVEDDTGAPSWLHHRLFAVGHSKVPADWQFEVDGDGKAEALWGPEEIVRLRDRAEALARGEDDAVAAFGTAIRNRGAAP
jgi:hypothetical protein